MQFWNELEGQTIDGRYPLRRLVRSEGRSAWFESEAGDREGTPATISLTEALTDADDVAARLQAAQNLKHPNLVTVLKVGQVNLDSTLFVYAVMEHIEQSLSDVLQGQALSADEAREVAEALVGSLTAIHQAGMSHGRVEAASVLATEETVKLRSDCLHLSTAAQQEDVAGIGTTLFHAFTQRKELSATDAQINRIPAPFAEIVRNSFGRRWTLAQVGNALKPAPPPVAVTQAVPVPAPAPISAPAPVPVRPPVALPAAVKAVERIPEKVAAPSVETVPVAVEEEPVAAKRTPVALYLGLAAVVLAILAWLVLRPGSQPAPAPTQAAPATAPVAAPPPTPKTALKKPAAARPAAVVPAKVPAKVAAPAAAAVASTGAPVWRVIAYTYRKHEDATAMLAKISSKHPNLKAEVFTPANRSIYLISVGGGDMDHEQAIKMLDKLRSMGFPEDSYVQNYRE